MTCASFDTRLDALLEGRCTPEEWREADAHLAGCPRCRRLYDAMSGRADDLDAAGHESLAASVLAKTSGTAGSCASARERLCDYVDATLDPVERELIDGHLGRCEACAVLALALSDVTAVLPSFAALPLRQPIVGDVFAATSRRAAEPGVGERITAWIARAAQRPRFSLEVAYVMTVLLLVVLGNPVDAFREASVRVQPRVSAVAGAVSVPLGEMRVAGAEKLSNVERALAPRLAPPRWTSQAEAWLGRMIDGSGLRWIAASAQAMATEVAAWAGRVFESLRGAFTGSRTELSASPARSHE
jgi:predicted anti-sigma-YlaC factor YlaD